MKKSTSYYLTSTKTACTPLFNLGGWLVVIVTILIVILSSKSSESFRLNHNNIIKSSRHSCRSLQIRQERSLRQLPVETLSYNYCTTRIPSVALISPSAGRSTASLYATPQQQQENNISSTNRNKKTQLPSKRKQQPRNKKKTEAITRNIKLSNLGKQGKWKEMFQIYQEEKDNFNNVNYSTMISMLCKMRNFNVYQSSSFHNLLDDLADQLENKRGNENNGGLEWMKARETSNILYAIGKRRLQRCNGSSRIINFICNSPENIKWLVKNGNTHDVANIAWAMAKLRVNCPELYVEIDKHSNWLVTEGQPQAISNTAWAFAKQKRDVIISNNDKSLQQPIQLFSEIDKRSEWLVREGTPQAVANIAWACGTLLGDIKEDNNNIPKNLFTEIERNAGWWVNTASAQAVSNTVMACAKLDILLPNFLDEIDNNAEALVRTGNTQAVANIMWAFATFKVKPTNLISAIEKSSKWFVNEGIPQNIANVAWAFGTLDVKSPTLFAEIEENANMILNKEAKPQEVANIAWAFGSLGVQAPDLFREIEKRSMWLVTNGSPQAIANTILSFAKLSIKAPLLVEEIEKRAEWLVKEGSHQAVANTAWAVSTLGMEAPLLFSEIEKRAEWLVKEGNTQDVANTLWAASNIKYHIPRLLEETNLRGRWLLRQGSVQNIANVALAFATMDYNATTFFDALEKNTKRLLYKFNVQSTCNICYSLVILDLERKHSETLSALWNKAIEMDPDDHTNESLNQLSQIEMVSKLNGMDLRKPPPKIREMMDNAKQDERSEEIQINNNSNMSYQKQISSCLNEIGFVHEEEVSPLVLLTNGDGGGGGILSIDMASRNERIAIEYDGPTHFLISLPDGEVTRLEDGRTKSKRRFLERLGWTVMNLNYHDDMECGDNRDKRIDWLRRELESVGLEQKIDDNA